MSARAAKVVLTSFTTVHARQRLLQVTSSSAGISPGVCLRLCGSRTKEILAYSQTPNYSSLEYTGKESSKSNAYGQGTMGHKRFYLPGNLATIYDFGLPSCGQNKILDPLKKIKIVEPEPKVEIAEPEDPIDRSMSLTHSILKRRRTKMNKHKLRKRRRRDAAKIRAVRMIRAKKKAKKRARMKKELVEKLEKIRADHPNSDYFTRPYVIHRLTNW